MKDEIKMMFPHTENVIIFPTWQIFADERTGVIQRFVARCLGSSNIASFNTPHFDVFFNSADSIRCFLQHFETLLNSNGVKRLYHILDKDATGVVVFPFILGFRITTVGSLHIKHRTPPFGRSPYSLATCYCVESQSCDYFTIDI